MSRPKGRKNVKQTEAPEPIIAGGLTDEVFPENDPVEIIETIEEKAPGVPDVKPEAKLRREYFHKTTWKGVIDTFQCNNCGHCDTDKGNMILHVITHVARSEQNKLFEKLTKEY